MNSACFCTVLCLWLSLPFIIAQDESDWSFRSQRPEIEPQHWIERDFTHQGHHTLVIAGDKSGHDNGSWVSRHLVKGGTVVHYQCHYYSRNVDEPNRSILTTLIWLDSLGKPVGPKEFPRFAGEKEDGWSLFEQTFQVPANVVSVEIELTYRWDGDGKVFFAPPVMKELQAMPTRKVTLAAIHHRPRQSNPDRNRKEFGELAAKAGDMGADIVCLPEGITLVGTTRNYVEVAETVPGPTTEYLGEISRQKEMYIVAGILEKDGDAVYNTAVLLDRQGRLAGKYRKVCLPREEIEGGVSPGTAFPVFDTDFGRIGIMICWDVAFPEPARELARQGADLILLPIWGGNINLAKARAIENQVYLVSSTYDMRTGIFDLEGNLISEGTEEHPIAIEEVDLSRQKLWPWLGEYKNRIWQEMPSKSTLE